MAQEENKLTGRTRHRAGWRGRLVLQVEYSYRTYFSPDAGYSPEDTAWRDATVKDVQSMPVLVVS